MIPALTLEEILDGNKNVVRLFQQGDAVPSHWYHHSGDGPILLTFAVPSCVEYKEGVFHIRPLIDTDFFVSLEAVDGEASGILFPVVKAIWTGIRQCMFWDPVPLPDKLDDSHVTDTNSLLS